MKALLKAFKVRWAISIVRPCDWTISNTGIAGTLLSHLASESLWEASHAKSMSESNGACKAIDPGNPLQNCEPPRLIFGTLEPQTPI